MKSHERPRAAWRRQQQRPHLAGGPPRKPVDLAQGAPLRLEPSIRDSSTPMHIGRQDPRDMVQRKPSWLVEDLCRCPSATWSWARAAASFLPIHACRNSLSNLSMLSNFVKKCQTLSKHAKLCQKMSNFVKTCQTLSNLSMLSILSDLCQTCQTCQCCQPLSAFCRTCQTCRSRHSCRSFINGSLSSALCPPGTCGFGLLVGQMLAVTSRLYGARVRLIWKIEEEP